ncbi:plasmodesmata-located protein 7 [Malania oleifera]|uniref:plasmodesmata-located protein 7 n=1 Tax=Malania oleifera TaxID=397392 RepID=UPI0025AE32E2|nr:plasmodesmata-located protein 7 [Malania oleifera]
MAATLPLILSLVTLSSLPLLSHSDVDSFIYGGCSQIKYTPNSPYESNLNSLLASLVNSATYSSYNNFTITGLSPNDVVYGLYQCRGDLSMPDCASCVARSVSQLATLCSQTCGGAVQLQGCLVKYDNSTFLGVDDKTVVLKKCGPPIGYNADAMGSRDAVLASMASASGPYRVGGSGDVQGVAQCVGDLSVSECGDCVSEAIGRLKSDCGTAVYGDMFLAKCYARYSASGVHPYFRTDDHDSSDEGQKTFAIIIGLFAGVALLIIFLSFLRKAFEGNGK